MIQSKSKRVQQLISLLKAHNIQHIVLSPGNRNVPIVHTIESDPFFKTYCITDERSAAFFALGMIEKLGMPVAACCTSGTAVANYVSAVSEAYYQNLPLLIISADRNPTYLNQKEDQMIPQVAILESVCKKSVSLPMEEDERSLQYSNRLLNEAFLELNHHGTMPVHINIPFEAGLDSFADIPPAEVRVVKRHTPINSSTWNNKLSQLSKNTKVLVLFGQARPLAEQERATVDSFARRFNCVFAVDHLSNYNGYACINTFYASKVMTSDAFLKLAPDVVITINGNSVSYIRGLLKSCSKPFEHWLVCDNGSVADPYHALSDIFECSAQTFFEMCNSLAPETQSHAYLDLWQKQAQTIDNAVLPYSDIYAVQSLMKHIPPHSLLHLGNSTSVRLAQHFSLDDTVEVYCNRGTNGIDGSLSAFIGQAALHDNLAFLLIGDLSFFYDMNGLWNRYVGSNVRIVLNNNSGATLFHYIIGTQKVPTLNNVTAADHNATAKGWAESLGIRYLCAHNREELDAAMSLLADEKVNAPIILEVFTSKEQDAEVLRTVYITEKQETVKDKLKKVIGSLAK